MWGLRAHTLAPRAVPQIPLTLPELRDASGIPERGRASHLGNKRAVETLACKELSSPRHHHSEENLCFSPYPCLHLRLNVCVWGRGRWSQLGLGSLECLTSSSQRVQWVSEAVSQSSPMLSAKRCDRDDSPAFMGFRACAKGDTRALGSAYAPVLAVCFKKERLSQRCLEKLRNVHGGQERDFEWGRLDGWIRDGIVS